MAITRMSSLFRYYIAGMHFAEFFIGSWIIIVYNEESPSSSRAIRQFHERGFIAFTLDRCIYRLPTSELHIYTHIYIYNIFDRNWWETRAESRLIGTANCGFSTEFYSRAGWSGGKGGGISRYIPIVALQLIHLYIDILALTTRSREFALQNPGDLILPAPRLTGRVCVCVPIYALPRNRVAKARVVAMIINRSLGQDLQ